MIGTVHEAFEENAVLQLEHMTCLMGQDFATPPEKDFLEVLAGLLSIESRGITGKAENPNTVPIGGLPKHEIPRRIRVEVLHGDR
jgi:hypothetical protein